MPLINDFCLMLAFLDALPSPVSAFVSESLSDCFRLAHLRGLRACYFHHRQHDTECDVLKIRVSVGGDPSRFSLSLCPRLFHS